MSPAVKPPNKPARISHKRGTRPELLGEFKYQLSKRSSYGGIASLARAGGRSELARIAGFWAVQVEALETAAASANDEDRLLAIGHLLSALVEIENGASPNSAFGWDRDPKGQRRFKTLTENRQRALAFEYFRKQGHAPQSALDMANESLYPGKADEPGPDHREAILRAHKAAEFPKVKGNKKHR